MSKLFSKTKALLSIVLVLCLLAVMLPTGIGVLTAGAEQPTTDTWDGTSKPFANYNDSLDADGKIKPEFANGTVAYQITSAEELKFLSDVLAAAPTNTETAITGVYVEWAYGDYKFPGNTNYGVFSGAKFELLCDIDLNGDTYAWTPIGTDVDKKKFHGTFEGNGHTISNLKCTSSTAGQFGLFGCAGASSIIQNLTVKNATFAITAASSAIGGIVGKMNDSRNEDASKLINCHVINVSITSATSGTSPVGGLVGQLGNNGGAYEITGCSVQGGTLGGRQQFGGLVGYVYTSATTANTTDAAKVTVSNSYCSAALTVNVVSLNVGGLFGKITATNQSVGTGRVDMTVTNCHFVGSINKAFPISGTTPTGLTLIGVYYRTGWYYNPSKDTYGTTTPTVVAGTEYSAEAFANGTVTQLLNGTQSDLWIQGTNYPIHKQDLPELTTLTVAGQEIPLKSGVYTYKTTVDHDKETVPVIADSSTCTVNTEITSLDLGIAGTSTKLTVQVTSANKLLTRTYTVEVYRNPKPWDGTIEPFENYSDSLTTNAAGNTIVKKDFFQGKQVYQITNAKQLAFLSKILEKGFTRSNDRFVEGWTSGNRSCYEVTLSAEELGTDKPQTFYFPGQHLYGGVFAGDSLDACPTFNLCCDIDLNGEEQNWTPIGADCTDSNRNLYCYSGKFEGNGHTISNLSCTRNSDATGTGYLGLFGYGTSQTVIKNLIVKNAKITDNGTTSAYIGGIIGRITLSNDATTKASSLVNCHVINSQIKSNNATASISVYLGGLFGYAATTGGIYNVDQCSVQVGTLDSYKQNFGGLIGNVALGAVNVTESFCSAELSTAVTINCGGLIGTFGDAVAVKMENCHFVGAFNQLYPISYKTTANLSLSNTYYVENYYDGTSKEPVDAGAGVVDANEDGVNDNEYSAQAFADGTVTKLLNANDANDADVWATSMAGYPVVSKLAATVNGALVDEGTQARTKTTTGLRFRFLMNTEAQVSGLQEYGVLLAKESSVPNGMYFGAVTTGNMQHKAAFDIKTNTEVETLVAAKVENPIVGENTLTGTYDNFAAVVAISKAANVTTEYAARASAKYIDALGQEIVVYSDPIWSQNPNDNINSLEKVAAKAAVDNNWEYDAAEKAYLNGVIKTAVGDISKELTNTYNKIRLVRSGNAKALNVAYLGGSITAGQNSYGTGGDNNDDNYYSALHSWRALTTKWLENTYDVEVNEIPSAIGGTGSIYGAHRVYDHLDLGNTTPDLVFIEFAANDYLDSKAGINPNPGLYMESIIRSIYKKAPKADIVMVITTTWETKDYTTEDQNVARSQHLAVAEKFGIRCIEVGQSLWADLQEECTTESKTMQWTKDLTIDQILAEREAGNIWWKYFSDSAHPAKAGYAKYAQYIQEDLGAILDEKFFMDSDILVDLSKYELAEGLPENPRIDTFEGLELSGDFEIQTTPSKGGDKITDPVGSITSTKVGASFTFQFTGDYLGIWTYGKAKDVADAGYMKVKIGDTEYDDVAINGGNHKLTSYTLAANETHTVTVTLEAGANDTVNFDLRYILTSGGDGVITPAN